MKHIKLFEQYLNNNFWNWFGDSKVVSQDNDPLVVYHGTEADFDNFSDELRGSRTKHDKEDVGYHFTNDPSYSDAYASTSTMNLYMSYVEMFPDEADKVNGTITI